MSEPLNAEEARKNEEIWKIIREKFADKKPIDLNDPACRAAIRESVHRDVIPKIQKANYLNAQANARAMFQVVR